ncbi:MAG TPA: hypothetical protein VLF20_03220 [Patescibacteria group bacterium]|nr:hypothetical protein [Patescibacteria group bacterium]
MNTLKVFIYTLFLAVLAVLFVPQAQASGTDSRCTVVSTGQYSSKESCIKLIIDKKVLKPGTKDYVDGLSVSDPKYNLDQQVTFQVVVQNVGAEELSDITIVDTMPQNVDYVSGAGSYDAGSRKLTFKLDKLTVGQSQTFYIVGKVTNAIAFGENGYVCVTNYVQASAKNGLSVDDAAQFCVERPVKVYEPVPVKKTPATGPEMLAIPMLFGMGGAGVFLRRKAGK